MEAVDDLAVTYESEPLAGEPLKTAVGVAKVQDRSTQIVVLDEQLQGFFAECTALGVHAPELQQPAASEDRRAEQRGQQEGREHGCRPPQER
jgi:hypothetical protein